MNLMPPPRLLAWNIRQAASVTRHRHAIVRHDADILVFRNIAAARRTGCADAGGLGYPCHEPTPPPGKNGVPSRRGNSASWRGQPAVPEPYRMVGLNLPALFGIYMPNLRKKCRTGRRDRTLGRCRGTAAIGDFNTCRAYVDEPGAIDATAHFIDEVERIGFCDLWRRRYPEGREFSWYSTRGNGFRIDHAFLSPVLAAQAGEVRYSHAERLAGLSDHSPLIIDLHI